MDQSRKRIKLNMKTLKTIRDFLKLLYGYLKTLRNNLNYV